MLPIKKTPVLKVSTYIIINITAHVSQTSCDTSDTVYLDLQNCRYSICILKSFTALIFISSHQIFFFICYAFSYPPYYYALLLFLSALLFGFLELNQICGSFFNWFLNDCFDHCLNLDIINKFNSATLCNCQMSETLFSSAIAIQ